MGQRNAGLVCGEARDTDIVVSFCKEGDISMLMVLGQQEGRVEWAYQDEAGDHGLLVCHRLGALLAGTQSS